MGRSFQRILVPVDFSEHSRLALDYAASLAERFEATLEILHVWEPPHYVAPDLMLAVPGWSAVSFEDYSRKEANRLMEDFLQRFERKNLRVTSRLESGHAAASILRVAAEGYDLIVMGTHGRGAFARLFLGSIAQNVVAHAPCPVLTVHAPKPAADKAPRL